MNNRRLLLILAVVLVLGAAVVTFGYLANANKTANTPPPRPVVVAVKNIAAKTRINDSMIAVVQKPADEIAPGSLASSGMVVGEVATADIPKDAEYSNLDVAPVASLGLAVQLRVGYRAVSIPVDQVKDVSDLIRPGDRVDVLSVPPRANGSKSTAFAILRGVTVLAIGNVIEAPPPVRQIAPAEDATIDPNAPAPTPVPATPAPPAVDIRVVTLEVNPAQADLLTFADINTSLRLALRSPLEPANSLRPEELIMPQNETPAPNNNPKPATHSGGPSVPVINGDQLITASTGG